MTQYKAIKYDFSGSNLTGVVGSPTVTSITPASTTEAALPLSSVVIAGEAFSATSTVNLVGASGTSIPCPSVTFDSITQLTVTIPVGVGGKDEDPWDVVVENPTTGQGDNLFTIDDNPIFTTGAGTIGTIGDAQRVAPAYSLLPVTATDPEGVTVTYSLVAPGPALSPGLSLNATNAAITGTAAAVPADTTTTFRVRATAGAETSDRDFSIKVNAPVYTFYTVAGAGTATVPFAGNAKVLVVGGGGGGSGGGNEGGGGAGGLIVHPAYAVTPGAYDYYLGSGDTYQGENSNWGVNTEPASTTSTVLTALGGGRGNGSAGGSGGGHSHTVGPGGAALQPNSPLISADAKTYGFGFAGGGSPYSGPAHPSGGGGGAAAVGGTVSGGNLAGNGGAGKDLTSDFGTSQGSPGGHFAGGGGGGTHSGGTPGTGGTGGGGNGFSGSQHNGVASTGSGGGSGASGGNGIIGIAY